MCYLVREQEARAAAGSGATLPPGLERLQPRWVGAIAAALVAGVAMAALVAPSPATAPSVERDAAAAIPVSARSTAVPSSGGADKVSLPADDGVPDATGVARSGFGNCHHGL